MGNRVPAGHGMIQVGQEWQCKCGVPLGGGPYGKGRAGARDVMRFHHADLAMSREGFWSKVDKSGDCWLWGGSVDRHGYGKFQEATGKTTGAHRIAYTLTVGPIQDGMQLDHTCHTPRCVNPAHLNPVTQKENSENAKGARVTSKSGIRGVWWSPSKNLWSVQVTHHGVRYAGGYFHSVAEAESAAIALRNQLHTNNLMDRRTHVVAAARDQENPND